MTDQGEPQSRRAAREATGKPIKPKKQTPDAPASSSGTAGTGIRALIAKHPTAWLAGALGAAFLMLGTGAVFAGAAVAANSAAPVVLPTETARGPRDVPPQLAGALAVRTCMVSAIDPALGEFAGAVVDAATGELLFDRDASETAPPASAVKALTAAAALSVLGADHQLSTRVYQGTEPGSIVLVGGGDPTLSAVTDSYYPNAPRLADLAKQVNEQWKRINPPVVVVPDPPREEENGDEEEGEEGTEPHPSPTERPATTQQQITKVIVDVGLWSSADRWNQGWARGDQTTGTMAEVVPLMVDGDRADPKKAVSPRSTDPTGRAVTAFVRALGLDPMKVQVTAGSALTSRPLLGEVKSQPVKQLVGHMLRTGDNTLAEQLARVVSVEVDRGGAAASLTNVIGGALAQHGIDVSGLALSDASGVSAANAVPPQVIAGLMAKVASGNQTLAMMNDTLPVAGAKGGLEGRFGGDSAVVHGKVRAMPGAIDGAQTLAGLIIAADGTPLGFSFHAVGQGGVATDAALDTLTAAVFNCGSNLSNV